MKHSVVNKWQQQVEDLCKNKEPERSALLWEIFYLERHNKKQYYCLESASELNKRGSKCIPIHNFKSPIEPYWAYTSVEVKFVQLNNMISE